MKASNQPSFVLVSLLAAVAVVWAMMAWVPNPDVPTEPDNQSAVQPPFEKDPPKVERKLADGVSEDLVPTGGWLVGVRFGTRPNSKIYSFQTIFMKDGRIQYGEVHGSKEWPMKEFIARDGYAVSSLDRIGSIRNARVHFMRISGDRLNPTDTYSTQWVVEPDQQSEEEAIQYVNPGLPVKAIQVAESGNISRPFFRNIDFMVSDHLSSELRPLWRFPELFDGGHMVADGRLNALEVGLKAPAQLGGICWVRPHYIVGNKNVVGPGFGRRKPAKVIVLRAPEGMGIRGLNYVGSLRGLSLVFAPMMDNRLTTGRTELSEVAGESGDFRKLEGNCVRVVGIVARADRELQSLGLIIALEDGTYAVLSGDRYHREIDVCPENGHLTGLIITGIDRVHSVQPVYQVNGKRQFGKVLGVPFRESVEMIAKDGFAVSGFAYEKVYRIDALKLFFSKLTDQSFDPTSHYSTPWFGYRKPFTAHIQLSKPVDAVVAITSNVVESLTFISQPQVE